MPTNKHYPPQKGVVFVGNATDLFGEWMDIDQIWSYFSKLWHFTPDGSPRPNAATYLFCTKRVHKMCDALRNYTIMPHAYFGFTAENQEWYDGRCLIMALENAKPGVNYWLSAEPLLGPIDLNRGKDGLPPFKWVAIGCESGYWGEASKWRVGSVDGPGSAFAPDGTKDVVAVFSVSRYSRDRHKHNYSQKQSS